MSQAMFSAKDRMDYRYFHKRSHYLAVIKAAIIKAFNKDAALQGIEVEWAYSMDDPRRPVISLKAGKGQSIPALRLHMLMNQDKDSSMRPRSRSTPPCQPTPSPRLISPP